MSKVIMEVFHYELLMVHSVEIKHATVAFVLSFLTPFHPDCYMYYFHKRLSALFRIESCNLCQHVKP